MGVDKLKFCDYDIIVGEWGKKKGPILGIIFRFGITLGWGDGNFTLYSLPAQLRIAG